MRTLFLSFILVLGGVARAGDVEDYAAYNRALSAFNRGEVSAAASAFYDLAEHAETPEVRQKSEYYLAQSLQKKGFPFAAFIYFAEVLKAKSAHPLYLKAVEGLVRVQEQLKDQDLIPNLLNNAFHEEWSELPSEVTGRINYLVATIAQRRGKFEEAEGFLQAIPRSSTIYAKSQYLLGVVLGDPRFPKGPKNEEALEAFERAATLSGTRYQDLDATRELAMLGLGRTYYSLKKYAEAEAAYARVPRFSRHWDEALFESGFTRFQADDLGGALGALQALHAPQFSGSFQPESWILKATAYYFSCLYEEAKASLAAFEQVYLPMVETLKPLVEEEHDQAFYFQLLNPQRAKSQLPGSVWMWVQRNERLLSVLNTLKEIDWEKRALAEEPAWKSSKMPKELSAYLDQNRDILVQVAGRRIKSRLAEAHRNIQGFSDQAEIIRFETSKAEKEIAEVGIDQPKLLSSKLLFRPIVPSESWNYWQFQGEFWRDEIGYYRYTLKKGCPVKRER